MWIFPWKQQKNEEGEGTQKSEAEATHLAPVRENPALATWGPQTEMSTSDADVPPKTGKFGLRGY